MGILEQVIEMKKLGAPDGEIMVNLREQGFSPREIDDALEQSKIKNAVYSEQGEEELPIPKAPRAVKSSYSPQSKEVGEEEYQYPQEEPPQENYPQQQQFYPQEASYAYPQQEGFSTDTIIEVAEQVFSEKTKKINKKLFELSSFKSISETKIENALERLKRIEDMMDKLQFSILEKVGSYGKTFDNVKKEMSMMQDSFGKMMGNRSKPAEQEEESEEEFSSEPKEELSDILDKPKKSRRRK